MLLLPTFKFTLDSSIFIQAFPWAPSVHQALYEVLEIQPQYLPPSSCPGEVGRLSLPFLICGTRNEPWALGMLGRHSASELHPQECIPAELKSHFWDRSTPLQSGEDHSDLLHPWERKWEESSWCFLIPLHPAFSLGPHVVRVSSFCWQKKVTKNMLEGNQKSRFQNGSLVTLQLSSVTRRTGGFTAQCKPRFIAVYFLRSWTPWSSFCPVNCISFCLSPSAIIVQILSVLKAHVLKTWSPACSPIRRQ